MANESNNTEAYVSTGKPKIGGAVYVGATSLTVPTNATGSLAAGFECMGYCSEDGVTNTTESSPEEIKAWGGDTVIIIEDDKSDNFQLTFIEALNVNVLKEIYGSSNVSGSLSTGISVTVSAEAHEARAWVIDMILKNSVMKRIVIPKGTITEVGDIVYKDEEPIGYPVTIKAASDSSGNYHYEYIQSATSST